MVERGFEEKRDPHTKRKLRDPPWFTWRYAVFERKAILLDFPIGLTTMLPVGPPLVV